MTITTDSTALTYLITVRPGFMQVEAPEGNPHVGYPITDEYGNDTGLGSLCFWCTEYLP